MLQLLKPINQQNKREKKEEHDVIIGNQNNDARNAPMSQKYSAIVFQNWLFQNFFCISMFVVSVIIGINEQKFLCDVSNQKNKIDIGQKPY